MEAPVTQNLSPAQISPSSETVSDTAWCWVLPAAEGMGWGGGQAPPAALLTLVSCRVSSQQRPSKRAAHFSCGMNMEP